MATITYRLIYFIGHDIRIERDGGIVYRCSFYVKRFFRKYDIDVYFQLINNQWKVERVNFVDLQMKDKHQIKVIKKLLKEPYITKSLQRATHSLKVWNEIKTKPVSNLTIIDEEKFDDNSYSFLLNEFEEWIQVELVNGNVRFYNVVVEDITINFYQVHPNPFLESVVEHIKKNSKHRLRLLLMGEFEKDEY